MKPKVFEVIYRFTITPTVPIPSILNWNASPVNELIRCKDCKWYRTKDEEHGFCENDNGMAADPYRNDYCSNAERKGE